MATTVEQTPLYNINPATFKWIFVIKDDAVVSGVPIPYWNVKFSSAVFIGPVYSAIGNAANIVATTKTVPNNSGVGMFDLSRFIESYTSPQYNNFLSGSRVVRFHGQAGTLDYYFPIHVIDNYSQNLTCAKYMEPRFKLEGATSSNLPTQPVTTAVSGGVYLCYNGYLQNSFSLEKVVNNFGFDFKTAYAPLGPSYYGFLSDAPLIQYAFDDDYGVVSFFNSILNTYNKPDFIRITGTFADGSTAFFDVQNTDANGGTTSVNSGVAWAQESILFFGVFPGNLRQSNTTFNGWLSKPCDLVSYTFELFESSSKRAITQAHTVVINQRPQGREYVPIRIGWLNTMGGWDYYTFKMKSSETIKNKRNDWTQIEGTWNRSSWNPQGWKGGKKTLTVNSNRKYKVNTDFLTDAESSWFEAMINSPEHYIIKPWESWRAATNYDVFEKHVVAVRLTTSSYKKKTIANDSLIQYSFDFEESRILKTQPV
tara:strand:- start:3080 stop:4525 length:1446 start_codon:yes stop_codon:yes gene_type:complete